MGNNILKAEKLSKVYKGIPVVDQINLEISEGRIYGLIGKNGAGKTTLIRMAAGLTNPTSGKLLLYGEENPNKWCMQRKKMSFIVETPYLQPRLSAYDNLKIQCLQKGIQDEKRIHEVLEMVDLKNTKKKKAEEFSLGMKQRLGIAISMLSTPEFLILDEPLNGLDPEGMLDMRKLLLQLKEVFKTTILISSHLLSELNQIATDYIIMDKGKIIEQINCEVLDRRCSDYLLVGINNEVDALKTLKQVLHIEQCELDDKGYLRIYDKNIDAGEIATTLVSKQFILHHLAYNKSSIEQYFISKIGGKIDV